MKDIPNAKWWSEGALRAAFGRVLSNGGGAGGDGVSAVDFGRDLPQNLRELSQGLQQQRLKPRPCRRYAIAKKDGGKRILNVPSVADRIWQTALAWELEVRLGTSMSDASFAYRRGRSIQDAAVRVVFWRLRGHVWVAESDINQFFDAIPHCSLKDRFFDLEKCEVARHSVGKWLQSLSSGRGLAQGSPLSPVLANLYLLGFDAEVDCKAHRLVRYADDFLLMARSRENAEAGLLRAKAALGNLGLTLNENKTHVKHINQGIKFLGHHFDGRGVVGVG